MDGQLDSSLKDALQSYVNLIDQGLDGLTSKHTNPIALQNVIDNFVGTLSDSYIPKQQFISSIKSVSPKFISSDGYRSAFDIFFKAIRSDILRLKPGEGFPTTISPDKLKQLVEEHELYLRQTNEAGNSWQQKWENNLRKSQQYALSALQNPDLAKDLSLAADGKLVFSHVPQEYRLQEASNIVADIQNALKSKPQSRIQTYTVSEETRKRLGHVDAEKIAEAAITRITKQYHISLGVSSTAGPQLAKAIEQINLAQGQTLTDSPYAPVIQEASWIASVVQFQKEILLDIKSTPHPGLSPKESSNLSANQIESISENTAVSLSNSWSKFAAEGFGADTLNNYLSQLDIHLKNSGINLTHDQLAHLAGEFMPAHRALQMFAALPKPLIFGQTAQVFFDYRQIPSFPSDVSRETPIVVPTGSSVEKTSLPHPIAATSSFLAFLNPFGLFRTLNPLNWLPKLNPFPVLTALNPFRLFSKLNPLPLLSRMNPLGAAQRTAINWLKKSIFLNWWFWLIVVFLIIVIGGFLELPGISDLGVNDVIYDIANTFVYQGKSIVSFTNGTILASGSCPIPPEADPKIKIGTYNTPGGHGTLAYWANHLPPYAYSMPDNFMYPPGCSLPGLCPYYGLAIDVTSGDAWNVSDVVVPYVCPAGQACSDPIITWKVVNVRPTKNGSGVYLETEANSHHWLIQLLHLNTSATVGDTFTTEAGGKNVVGQLTPQKLANGNSNAHVHFEVSMDGIPIDPTPFCSGGINTPGVPVIETLACTRELMRRHFAESLVDAALCICNLESGGNTAIVSRARCTLLPPHNTMEISRGLFQINCLAHDAPGIHCLDGVETYDKDGNVTNPKRPTNSCKIINRSIVNDDWPANSKQAPGTWDAYYSDADNNVAKAAELYNNNNHSWGDWRSSATACKLLH